VLGKEKDWLARVTLLESESLYKGRTILVIHEPMRGVNMTLSPGLFRKRWDCIFRVRDTFEAQMLATYVANAPKPVRILWLAASASQEIPRALWQKWERTDVTLLGASTQGEMLGCEWEVIFFPLDTNSQAVERVLSMRGSGMRTLAQNVGSYLNEIAQNGAALVWSNIDEADTRGALYWYDPSEGDLKEHVSKTDAVKMLEDVIGLLKA
jgi:hypothetical protein